MNSLISRSTVLLAAATVLLLATTPARAQSDQRADVAAASAAALVPTGGPTGLSASHLTTSSLSQGARAEQERGYAYGPVTQVGYNHVEYGHFEEYMAWVTSTWMPTMEAAKKAGLIIDYKVFRSSPKSPDQPNLIYQITYKNMAAYAGDIGDAADAFEAVANKVICSSACQDQARVKRGEIRKFLGSEVIRQIVFK